MQKRSRRCRASAGSSQFRGSAFFLNRPNALVGPNFFNEIRDIPTNDQYWRTGGGGIGGPIVREKTFFWAPGEVYRDGQSQNDGLHVLSPRSRWRHPKRAA